MQAGTTHQFQCVGAEGWRSAIHKRSAMNASVLSGHGSLARLIMMRILVQKDLTQSAQRRMDKQRGHREAEKAVPQFLWRFLCGLSAPFFSVSSVLDL